MKRATQLKVLATALVVVMVASAFPLAQVLLDQVDSSRTGNSPSSSSGSSNGKPSSANADRLPFGPAGAPEALAGLAGAGATGGTSSRPWTPGIGAGHSTGSAVLDEVIGAASAMGYKVSLPDLPLDELAAVNPLRPAILAWMTVTNSQVAPSDLARELARADALPQALQRDLAIVVLSAAKATLLQHEALAFISSEDLVWIRSHPELASDLANGVTNADTLRLASLAARVDIKKSIEASLLILEAVEATRGSLADPAATKTVNSLSLGTLDPTAESILQLLTTSTSGMSDAQKVRFAAQLISTSAGITMPAALPDVSFAQAVQRLIAATGQEPDAAAIQKALDTAALLPEDLQLALAKPILAEALAVEAAMYPTPATQSQALVGVLNAIADALPTLEKYHLYWRSSPEALRIAQWTPSARVGWALEHAGMIRSTQGDLVDLVRAGGILHGVPLQDAVVPDRSFSDAFIALAGERGYSPTTSEIEEVRTAGDSLEDNVRDAAARMMSGAAEAARLNRLAFRDLSSDERFFLLTSGAPGDLFTKKDITDAELAKLVRIVELSERVDLAKLSAAEVVGVRATLDARDLLTPKFSTQSVETRSYSWLDSLAKLLPWTTASAQTPPIQEGCAIDPIGIVETNCPNDVLIRISLPFRFFTFGNFALDENSEILVITGPGASNIGPQEKMVFPGNRPAFGAANVFIDLDGGDTYNRPVAMTYPTQQAPVSLHLDMGGSDYYTDPSNLYDANTGAYVFGYLGRTEGMQTQASAIGGGVAVLIDVSGNDRYEAPHFSQGYGQWGLGLLADFAGNDLYVGGRFSQGASGRDLNAGVGILVDLAGDDEYSAKSGQGFGLGGILLDAAGRDSYANQQPAMGTPIVHLTVLPGENLTTLNDRKDNLVWLDGPAALNLGLGVDTEVSPTPTDEDGDLFSNFVEFHAGTDPKDSASTPLTQPTARAGIVTQDSDRDTFPDYVERALSTDANDPTSYPVGFPRGPTFVIPLVGSVTIGESTDGLVQDQPTKQDKIIDLRLPLQNAGSIDYACVGAGGNSTGGSKSNTALNLTYTPFYVGIVSGGMPPDSGTFHPNQTRPTPQGPCVLVGYSSDAPGNGTGTLPEVTGLDGSGGTSTTPGDESKSKFNNFTFRIPAGILAIGDSVSTSYDVDYFFVLDLGGDDSFVNRAGGALAVNTTRREPGAPDDGIVPVTNGPTGPNGVGAGNLPRNMLFLAPSVVLNVDLAKTGHAPTPNPYGARVESANNSMGHDSYFAPDAGTFAQGSLLGILIDTAGDDNYTASSGSQGSLGGVLLDLAGDDVYLARDLSQGAGLASTVPASRSEGLPNVPSDSIQSGTSAPNNDAAKVRGLIPGFLADFGSGNDDYRAGNHSQGFARGFTETGASLGLGVLFDDGGDDSYDTALQGGLNSQGVGHQHGLGILVDLAGSDTYTAQGIVSQGATMSQSYFSPGGDRGRTGAGLLVDLASPDDAYLYYDRNGEHDRSTPRQNNLTLTRGDIDADPRHVALSPGIHYDGEGVNASAIFHAGGRELVGAPTGADGGVDTNAFFVDLPAARLAIGNGADTTYAYEYALVIDLGGVNTYHMNAGGFVPDILVRQDTVSTVPLNGPIHPTYSMFPVSLVYDAGSTGSTYSASRGLVQGAGYFGVGIVADLGGNDTFVVQSATTPGAASSWAATPPVIDGSISPAEWKSSVARQLVLTDENDTRFTEPLTLRVTNDERNVYLAIQSHTASKRDTAHRDSDNVLVELNGGRTNTTWNDDTGFTNVDYSRLFLTGPGCRVVDGYFPAGPSPEPTRESTNHVRAACSVAEDGTFSLELAKPIREGYPKDTFDLALPYDADLGYLVKQLGLRIAFYQSVTGDTFVWPANSRDEDGLGAYRTDENLAEEMNDWAAYSLANLGFDGKIINATRTPAVSQAASIGGVGIIAALGTISSPATYTALDHAQGYGGFGGLGFLLDMGSSDKYVATTFAQGASEETALGILLDADGNDNYLSQGQSLGYNGGGGALFIDLHGDDEYAISGADSRPVLRQSTAIGIVEEWSFVNGGVGLDYLSKDDVRSAVWGPLATIVWSQPKRTNLTVSEVDEEGRCTRNPANVVVTGLICVAVEIDLTGGPSQAAGTLSVDAVDFLGNGRRFATATVPDSVGSSKPRFTTILNASLLPDGVVNLTGIAQIRLVTAEHGVILFSDRYSDGNSGAAKRVLVNNPTKTVICTSPKLNVEPEFLNGLECLSDAPAIFSPLALNHTFAAADIKWGVSHDAGEDRVTLAQEWVSPAHNRNFPCDASEEVLCDFVPLYFRKKDAGAEWNTDPANYPAYDSGATITEKSKEDPFFQKSRTLKDNLTLFGKDAFHVYMDNRTQFLFGNYSTNVTVTLVNDKGNVVVNSTGHPIILGHEIFFAQRALAPLSESVSAAYNNTVRPTVNSVIDSAANTVYQGVVKSAIANLYTSCVTNPVLGIPCDQLRADVGANGARVCRNESPWDTLSREDRPLCKPSAFDRLNATASDADSRVGPPVRDAATDAINRNNIFPGDRADNWSHLFFDANLAIPAGTPGVRVNSDGTLTIEKGYGFQLVIYSDSDTILSSVAEELSDVRGIYDDNVRDPIFDAEAAFMAALRANETYQEQCASQPIACDTVESLIENATYNTINGPVNGVSENVLKQIVAHPPIPISRWELNNGSRLDLRVPAVGHTTTTLTIDRVATNETVRTLFDGIIPGDLPGGATIDGRIETTGHSLWSAAAGRRFTQKITPFDGKNDAGDALPDGLYRARLVAADDSNRIANTTIQTILVDQTPPTSQLQTRGYAGLATLSGGSGLPLQWTVDEAGAGLERVWVYRWSGTGSVSDASQWTILTGGASGFPAGVNIGFDSDRVSTRSDYYYVTIAKDRAGNYEFQSRVRELIADGSIQPAGKPFELLAFLAKLRDGVMTLIVVDTGSPIQLAPPTVDGGTLLYFRGSDTAFVRAGAPFKASVCVSDPEHGVDRVTFVFDFVSATTGAVSSHMFDGTVKGACGAGGSGTSYEYAGWGALNTNKTTFPDGPWSLTADVFDLAGNRIQVPVTNVVLDSEAPTVRFEAPIYPPGQAAVKPGDRVTLRLFAEDAYGVNDLAIRVDARSISTQGLVGTVARRIDGIVYQEATFTVDAPNVNNGIYELSVTVPDNAGNLNASKFLVVVDFKKFTIDPTSVTVTNVTHNAALLKWRTSEPTTSLARYGTSALDLKLKTPTNATLVTNHSLLVEGLQPSTHYYFRAVSSTAGGYTNESETLEALTTTALYLQPLSPAAGSSISGPTEIRFRGGLHDSAGFVTYTLDVRPSDDSAWTFVTTLTEQGDEHALIFNSSRYLDGPGYSLRLSAAAGKDIVTKTIGPFLSDNTPPELTVFSPLIATNDTTPMIRAEARDNLALFGSEPATLTIDGYAVEGELAIEPSGQAVNVRYDVPSALASGAHTIILTVKDRAGNVATQTWKVSIDSEAPIVRVEPTRYSPGPAAAKIGGDVTLNLTITDASGVSSVIADTTAIATQPTTTLTRVVGTDRFVGTFTVTARDDNAVKRVLITAIDLAGNAREAGVDVVIDNAKPTVSEPQVSEVTQTRSVIGVTASEPVTLVGTASAPNSPPVTAATKEMTARPLITFAGLLPSRTYSFTLQALDRAGNAVDLAGKFQTDADLKAPSRVATVSVLDLLNGTLRLSWSAATDDVGIDFYRIYRSDDGANYRPLSEVKRTTFDDRNLPLEKTFVYQIVAVDYGGNEGPVSESLRAAATAVPRLSAGIATPSVGSTATVFEYSVTYVSPGGVTPTFVRVILDGAPQEMRLKANGVYVYETRLAPHERDHPHTYSFEASDGRYTAHYPEDGSVLRGPLVSSDALAGETSGVGFASRVPLLGAVGTTLALAAAAVAIVILRRRESK